MKTVNAKTAWLLATLFVPMSVFSAATSGVDITKSTISINFTPDTKANITSATCFGETINFLANNALAQPLLTSKPFSEIEAYYKHNANTSTETISRKSTDIIHVDINNTDNQDLKHCFKHAGTYDITIKLVDAVENETTKDFKFIVKPGEVDVADLDSNIGAIDCANATANGVDACTLEGTLKDSFGNTSYEVQNIELNFPNGDNLFLDDANFGLKFNEGVFTASNQSSSIIGKNILEPVTDGLFSVKFKSWAPTITKDAQNIVQDTSFQLASKVFQITGIKNDGNAGSMKTVDQKLSPKAIKFNRPINMSIGLIPGKLSTNDPSDQFMLSGTFTELNNWQTGDEVPNNLNKDHRLKVTLTHGSNAGLIASNMKAGFLPMTDKIDLFRYIRADEKIQVPLYTDSSLSNVQNELSIEHVHSYRDSSGGSVGIGFDQSLFQDFSNADNPSNYYQKNGNTEVNYILNYKLNPSRGTTLTPNFVFQSFVEYLVDFGRNLKSVRYFAGNNNISIQKALGALIEGLVVKRNIDTPLYSDYLNVVAGMKEKDVREVITRNAFGLARNSNNSRTSDVVVTNATDFGNQNVLVVDGANVKLSGALPSGKKTLIIKDGNLLISGNTWYQNEANDSFGVILVNSKNEPMPATGNIFVHSSVQNVRGSFFADGGLMNTNETQPGSLNVNNVVINTTKQLRFVGALMTMNTIGGSGKTVTGAVNTYNHPWGSSNDEALAKRYDLLYIRDTFKIDQNLCLNKTTYNNPAIGNCDTLDNNTNPNQEVGYSFILRFDRKAVEMAPPGFTRSQSISR